MNTDRDWPGSRDIGGEQKDNQEEHIKKVLNFPLCCPFALSVLLL
jgi:hypothetical protein